MGEKGGAVRGVLHKGAGVPRSKRVHHSRKQGKEKEMKGAHII